MRLCDSAQVRRCRLLPFPVHTVFARQAVPHFAKGHNAGLRLSGVLPSQQGRVLVSASVAVKIGLSHGAIQLADSCPRMRRHSAAQSHKQSPDDGQNHLAALGLALNLQIA